MSIKAKGSGRLGHALAANPQPVDIELQLGSGKRYCLQFGGVTTFKPRPTGSVFQAKDAPAPATCPP